MYEITNSLKLEMEPVANTDGKCITEYSAHPCMVWCIVQRQITLRSGSSDRLSNIATGCIPSLGTGVGSTESQYMGLRRIVVKSRWIHASCSQCTQ